MTSMARAREEASWWVSPADYDLERATKQARKDLADSTYLAELEDYGWELELVRTRGGFDEYIIPLVDIPVWVCSDCGALDVEPIEGCHLCGLKEHHDD
jgi:hypothetical protein